MALYPFKIVAGVTVAAGSRPSDVDLTYAIANACTAAGLEMQAVTVVEASPDVYNVFADALATTNLTYGQVVTLFTNTVNAIVTVGGNIVVNTCTASTWAGEPTPSGQMSPNSW
jgi:hypothetical protein